MKNNYRNFFPFSKFYGNIIFKGKGKPYPQNIYIEGI